jgi:hypothetical protein
MDNETTVRTGISTHARILIAIALCVAMVLAISGVSGVFAADDDGADDAIRIVANDEFEGSSLSVRASDDGIEYSVDGDKTWTTEVPEGVTVTDDSGFNTSKSI